MTFFPTLPAIREIAPADFAAFHDEVRPAGRPVVIRNLVANWPSVVAARQGMNAMIDYLNQCGTTRPVWAITAPFEAGARFFYNAQMTGLNFEKRQAPLSAFLTELAAMAEQERPAALAVQSETITDLSPRFAADNQIDLLPGVIPRFWIGNKIRVAPHFDLMENIACNVAGRRRFTLFPPEQLPNLYPGPFELTPAGTPVSLVDMAEPDLTRFPNFATAWKSAEQVTLEPGDALYIPYAWWHGVESLEPLSILVNYWWSDIADGIGGPYDALLHAIMSFRHLPQQQRDFWKLMIDHYVFDGDGNPAQHIPQHARGILAPPSPQLFARMRTLLRQALG